ncbi:tRNA (adenine(22)-N(1))-methyltransferase [Aeribacillus pallidus]|uniref:tRNA (adenine(22)-N(1))-methyltransferase n=1 Tax=Aeribacillus pallidus TaxID=33936 RepID=UPI003D1938A3
MNAEKLSKRLERVATYVPNGATVADIGSDHAYLPCYLVKQGVVKKAIAGEVVEGPFQSAVNQVKELGLESHISVRKGDGLEVVAPGEVDCITIAGMGGTLIANILERGKNKLSSVKRLVLQPNIGAPTLRKWLYDHCWEIIAEEILEEEGKIYEIIVAEKGDPSRPYNELEKELLLGPFLIHQQNGAFRKKWEMELKEFERILSQISKATPNERVNKKRIELEKKIAYVKEVLNDENPERS